MTRGFVFVCGMISGVVTLIDAACHAFPLSRFLVANEDGSVVDGATAPTMHPVFQKCKT